jgi:hypothetical protein
VKSQKSVVINFADVVATVDPTDWLPNTRKSKTQPVRLGSHYDIVACISQLIDLFRENSSLVSGRVFIDVTCLPKLMLQWIIMEFLKSKLPTELILGYVSGSYSVGKSSPIYDQGVREYVAVPHSCAGGVSTKKACIAALGADERLVSDYFDSEIGFDHHFLLASVEVKHTAIADQVKHQIDSLRARHYLTDADIAYVSASSFIDSITAFEAFLAASEGCDEWEVFCSGPKPHAVAASLVAMKHRSVRLTGRVPRTYDESDVAPGPNMALYRIVDLTNPRVAALRGLANSFP